MEVFLLWHVRHARNLDGTPTEHRDEAGLVWDEQEGDDVKLLGVYSSEAPANDRIHRARALPGFEDEPDCFFVGGHIVDEDKWQDGFFTEVDEEV